MTTVHLAITRGCDRACPFCDVRAAESRPLAVRTRAAAAQLREAVAHGATAVVFTGAEPTLEPYLVELVQRARQAGVTDIGLQTHGGLVDTRVAGQLAAAGLRRAEVALNTLHAPTADALTGSPGDLKRSAAGVRALLAAGVDVDLAVALLADNAEHLGDLRRRAGRLADGCKGRIRRVVVRAIAVGPRPFARVALATATGALTSAAAEQGGDGPPVEQAPGWELPPCLFSAPEQTPGLFRMSQHRVAREACRYQRLDACAACALADRCPGCPPAWAQAAQPLADPAACAALAARTVTENSVVEGDDLLPLSAAALEARWPALRAGLGLEITAVLAEDARAGLRARRPPDHPPWPISAAECDREALELRAGLRVLLRREVTDPGRASGAVEALRRQGLLVRVVHSAVVGVAGQARTHVFAALDPAHLDAAEQLDPALDGDDRTKVNAIRQFGRWFGYPPCCVEAFAGGSERDDAVLVADRVRRQGRAPSPWPANWTVVPVRLGSFLPCAPDCVLAVRHARRVVELVQAAAPGWLAAARPLLQSAVLALGFDRAAVLVGARAEPDGWRYDRVVGPAQLVGQAAFVPRLPLLAFEWMVTEALRTGDRLVDEGRQVRIVRSGETRAVLRWAQAGPRVVDFTAQ
ncbi:MAG: radical SAM protein [Deltaproteobacteria bacterium]|nr:radical SAM protein [Deltaproteobacteria bacterium]